MNSGRIAVVGLACRYPDATSATQLWQNVLARRKAFRRIPGARLSARYQGGAADPDSVVATHAAVLRDWTFDRARFGIPGPLHRAADHTHWLALETAADALADAGYPEAEGLDRDAVGVVMGNSLAGEFTRAATLRTRWPFIAGAAANALSGAGIGEELAGEVLGRMEALVKEPFPVPGDETLAGSLANTIAGRICNHFDLHGTGYTVDGACSSSLLAVMTGCRALAAGELDLVLAGGVDMSLDPFELVGFSRLGALAADEMRVYDERPTGFLPGEGCGVVALMRAEDAERAGRRGYASLIGWASSSDGAGGLTRPEQRGQILAMRRAYAQAGVGPETVELVEGHGTGTAVGDEVELAAQGELRAGAPSAALGSVKANIGHTKAAAGVAGLIKAVLAVHHRVLPPTTGCERPHALLRRKDAPLRILAEAEPWTAQVPRASVSSMGFGGINAHVVLEGVPGPARSRLGASVRRWARRGPSDEIVLVGADSADALTGRLRDLERSARALSVAEVGDLAGTAWRDGAGDRCFRAALVVSTPDGLAAAAGRAAAAAGRMTGTVLDEAGGFALGSGPAPRIGLLLPGQAAPVRRELPWWARELGVPEVGPVPETGSVPAAVSNLGAGPNVLPAGEDVVDTAIAQPAIVRQSLAALAWLDELGTVAAAACGHSLGELTALGWAGALAPDEVLALAVGRGEIMARLGKSDTGMAGLGCGAEQTRELLAEATLAGDTVAGSTLVGNTLVDNTLVDNTVEIAGHNAPDSTVVAGERAQLRAVVERAREAGIPASLLAVSHGFHSEAMRPAIEPFRALVARLPLTSPRRTVLSTVTGKEFSGGPDELRALLVDQLTAPVLFADALAELGRRCDLLVEAGPGAILSGLVQANGSPLPTVTLDAGGDPARHAFATAALAAVGAADLTPWFSGRGFRTLPADAVPGFVPNPCESQADPSTVVPARRPPAASAAVPEPVLDVQAGTPLELLIAHLAEKLELAPESIRPDSSLLGDLHLNSLQVTETVFSAARALGRRPPDSPVPIAQATVSAAAELIGQLPVAGDTDLAEVPGVAPWVRSFVPCWVPFFPESSTVDEKAEVVRLAGTDGPEELAALLTGLDANRPERLVLLHHRHPAAAGIARSVVTELGTERCAVVDLADAAAEPDDLSALLPEAGYRELRATAGGYEQVSVRLRVPGEGGVPDALRHGDLCLVTGGVHGITAHTAVALAERTGCRLLFAGRTPPDDPALAARLEELRGRISEVGYARCDVTDAEAVRKLVETRGPIRGLLHGAGVNQPRRIAEITGSSLAATLAPKVTGLANVLVAAGEDLRLVLGFGSIIGRQGLAGQAEYCVANDWLRVDLEQWAAAHPLCRAHVLEWSVWSGAGMGERMGVLDRLRGLGVEPVDPELGTAALLDLLGDPTAPVTALVSSRFPATPTLRLDGAGGPWGRFTERVLVHLPGVEAVVDASLSAGTDPWLGDHVIDGVEVLPGVLGLEAMVQAARLAGAPSLPLDLSEVRFRAPVTVEEPDGRGIRLVALAGADGVDAVLRESGAVDDRFSARISAAAEPDGTFEPAEAPAVREPYPWYGRLFFHSGRFRRVTCYDELTAFTVEAWLSEGAAESWFSQFHSGNLELGDPAAHDATLHALLACMPHRWALPGGADRLTVWRHPRGPLRVLARERAHTADDFEFDVDLVSAGGAPVARWDGLRLHAGGARPWPGGLPTRLVGPWLTRRLIESGVADAPELRTGGDQPADLSAGDWRAEAEARVLGSPAEPREVECTTEDGIVLARYGSRRVVTADVAVEGAGHPVALAVPAAT